MESPVDWRMFAPTTRKQVFSAIKKSYDHGRLKGVVYNPEVEHGTNIKWDDPPSLQGFITTLCCEEQSLIISPGSPDRLLHAFPTWNDVSKSISYTVTLGKFSHVDKIWASDLSFDNLGPCLKTLVKMWKVITDFRIIEIWNRLFTFIYPLLNSLKTNIAPEKPVVGRLLSVWEGLFSGASCSFWGGYKILTTPN